MTGYALGSMAGAWQQHVKFTFPGYILTYFGFPNVHAVLSVTFIPGFVLCMD